jgi:hypothetical protein
VADALIEEKPALGNGGIMRTRRAVGAVTSQADGLTPSYKEK